MRPLSAKLAKIAREELNETPERIQQDLNILKVWIGQQSHLRARVLDDFLIAFLRCCRYSLEETKKRIDKYYTFYNLFPEVMRNRCVSQRMLDINRFGVHYYPEIPKDGDETALLIARYGHYDKKRYNMREIFQFVSMAMEIIVLESDNAAVAGVCMVCDMSGVVFDYSAREEEELVWKKWYDWTHLCCPMRYKECYFINCTKDVYRWMKVAFALKAWDFDYPVYVLKTTEKLYNYIPRQCLPEEYGGCNGNIAECVAYMKDLLNSYREYFREDANYGTCEELRSAEVVTYEAEFGADGSFRKLEVD